MPLSLSSAAIRRSFAELASYLICGFALTLIVSAKATHADTTLDLSNTATIDLPQTGSATLYPSTITSTVAGRVTKVSLTLNDLNHTYTSDLDVMLVAPSGQRVLVMSDAFNGGDAVHTNLTIADSATQDMPVTGLSTTGNVSYRPTDYIDSPPDSFPAPAPTGSRGTKLSTLAGASVEGAWKLYVVDDTGGDTGQITGGWTLHLTYDTAPLVSYVTPAVNEKILLSNFGAGSISGKVVDNKIVTSVKVRLSRKRDGVNVFWDGTNFVTDFSAIVDATFKPTGAASGTWSLDTHVPPTSQLDEGLYSVRVYAFDNGTVHSLYADRSFSIILTPPDTTKPTVSITAPTSNQVVNINSVSGSAFNGTATDNIGVTSVKLKFLRKRGTTTEYWNGSAFTATVALFDAAISPVGATSVTWQLAHAIPAGQLDKGGYTLYANSYDAAGNAVTSSSRVFNVTGTANSPVSSGPSAGGS